MGQVIHFYDRSHWPVMLRCWEAGTVAVCPVAADPMEWRESAKRLARSVGVRVRTGLRTFDKQRLVVAEANEGFPLGITDPYERDAWLRRQCRGCEAVDG